MVCWEIVLVGLVGVLPVWYDDSDDGGGAVLASGIMCWRIRSREGVWMVDELDPEAALRDTQGMCDSLSATV